MNLLPASKASASFLSCFFLLVFNPQSLKENEVFRKPANQKIQVAILLDVSGSMQGLIEQAKSQLWNMVNILSKVKCETGLPEIEVALFEYGRTTNDSNEGFIKHIIGFTKELDKVYSELSPLKTDGGDEFCGYVINTSLDKLQWDVSPSSYKVIFIAGNESFLQGNVSYITACKKAQEKAVIVNTIYCGSRDMGIKENWNLGGECGNGSYTNIDQNAKEEYIPSPYDNMITSLNEKINKTYVYYGEDGEEGYIGMRRFDTIPVHDANDISKIMQYKVVKADGRFRNDGRWDLVTAYEKDSTGRLKYDKNTLADSLKNKSTEEINKIIKAKAGERNQIRSQMSETARKRDRYIDSVKSRRDKAAPQTLESEIEKIIKRQITLFKMRIE